MKETLRSKGFSRLAVIDSPTGSVPLSQVPPLLRVLLAQDGTVTRTLEAYFWEPIAVLADEQDLVSSSLDCPLAGVERGTELLQRSVRIVGESSQRLYCLASSLIRIDALPHGLAEKLLSGKIGIGELLRDRELETFRELEKLFVPESPGGHIARAYQIHLNRQPVIRVLESFPTQAFR